MEIAEKILTWYLKILLVFLISTLTLGVLVAPLVLGLIFSPWCFLGYLSLLILGPVLIVLWIVLPDVIRGLDL